MTGGRRQAAILSGLRHDATDCFQQIDDIRRGWHRAGFCRAGRVVASWWPRKPIRRNMRSTPICSRPPAWRRCSRSSTAITTGRTELPPLSVDGKPNYNLGPIKFATRRIDVLGHRRLRGRSAGRRCSSRFRSLNFDLPWIVVRPYPSAAYLGGDLRLRRQRADRDVVLCRAAYLPRAPRRRHRAVVRRAGLQLLHPDRRHRLSARHHRNRRNMPSRNGTPTCG